MKYVRIHPLGKCVMFLIIGIFSYWGMQGQEQDVSWEKLEDLLAQVKVIDAAKNQRLINLKEQLVKVSKERIKQQYEIATILYQEYKVFNRDSAFYYAEKSYLLSTELSDRQFEIQSRINLIDICVSSGMYYEALAYVAQMDTLQIQTDQKSLYYGLLGRCYGDMAEYSDVLPFRENYLIQAKRYREVALAYTQSGTFFHSFLKAFNKYKEGKLTEALADFQAFEQAGLSDRDFALVHYITGEIYSQLGYSKKAVPHYSYAAMADIKNSTKESLAIIKLAAILFQNGDVNHASVLIQKAYEDAVFYGAQQRKIQVGAIFPLIEQQLVANMEKEKERLYWQYMIAIGILIAVAGLTLVIFNQYRRIRKAEQLLSSANGNLTKANNRLEEVNQELKFRNQEIEKINKKLQETNEIKEEYVGFFFTQYDDIFEKFNDFMLQINEGVAAEDFRKIAFVARQYHTRKEKNKLLKNFDRAFMELYPNFIEEYNKLMQEPYRIHISEGDALTKELRIYALLKLGISHNEKIAQILGYSVNSIYAYKTKVRNQSVVLKHQFDELLLENTSFRTF
ncbi:hypothetical protein SAMN05216480_107135 [Pustulibacterium marinum]|uniref:DUF6377 domain-containing protein n=1 Tax=Pustulibacterium marinum TaxID=1224947 RepID=A0A1I7H6N9_9FLAO|nr:DUF6377 domain-containing protein [Pustulibacterium marinum]SFU56345.1 hypothetical protein SAMN05216480_107135 [Pustulibacterium marinum]